MPKVVIMPKQGQSVESCIITEFKKKVGDTVAVGDVLFSYETDKASFDEESQVEGTVLAIFYNENDEVPVLTNVMVIGNPGEAFDEFAPSASPSAAPQESAEVAEKEEEKPVSDVPAAGEVVAGAPVSPRARRLAEKKGVDTA
ncbi:MAG: 2-oxo acid dehydrogenase subunit E2, partial [Bacteroidales bacterium]|nr:2-oxo acid dehydrogenase subunit E2 [Bacteroidales bacterium]